MQPILECCCGVDVHKDMIEACIICGTENPIFIRKQFQTLPSALQDFVHWLFENDCFHIAMESTGIYWRPVYEAIEEFSPYKVNQGTVCPLLGQKADSYRVLPKTA